MDLRQRGRRMFAGARITQGALYLLFAEVGLSLVYLFLDDPGKAWVVRYLVATDYTVWSEGKVWTLLTSIFIEPDFIGLVFHGFILWMFVPALERWWGMKRFLIFAVATSAASNLVGTLVGSFLAGPAEMFSLDAFIYASIVAYGIVFARQQVQFFGVIPLTGRQLMYGILGFMTLFIVLQGAWAQGAGFASAIGVTYVLTSDSFAPKLWYLKWKHKRLRRHLKLVPDDDKKKKWVN